jgi:hypothetical protein
VSDKPIEPYALSQQVERFVEKQFASAERYENSEVLDDSGVYELHELVAEAYAMGWRDGHMVGDANRRAAINRAKELRAAAESPREGK